MWSLTLTMQPIINAWIFQCLCQSLSRNINLLYMIWSLVQCLKVVVQIIQKILFLFLLLLPHKSRQVSTLILITPINKITSDHRRSTILWSHLMSNNIIFIKLRFAQSFPLFPNLPNLTLITLLLPIRFHICIRFLSIMYSSSRSRNRLFFYPLIFIHKISYIFILIRLKISQQLLIYITRRISIHLHLLLRNRMFTR